MKILDKMLAGTARRDRRSRTDNSIEVLYLNSFSRSGETLLLRVLDAHPDIHVLHQLYKLSDEGKELYDMFKVIKKQKPNWLKKNNKYLVNLDLQGARTLCVKNSIFENTNAHKGMILVRNPFSICKSYLKLAQHTDIRKQMSNWARNIDPKLLETVKSDDTLTAICALYNRKMSKLFFSDLPVLHYERFVQNPCAALRPVLAKLGFRWDNSILNSHVKYKKGHKGHGGMSLWKEINDGSLHSYRGLDETSFRKIYGMCYPVMEMYGYELDRNNMLSVRDDYDCRL